MTNDLKNDIMFDRSKEYQDRRIITLDRIYSKSYATVVGEVGEQ
jgi:hypothetical protein